LDWVGNNGKVSVVYRFPIPSPMELFPTDAVPTCVASAGGQLTVADLAGRIWHVSGGNATLISDQGGNHYTGCAADGAGNVYVVSMFSGLFPNPGTGSIVKVSASGTVSTLSNTNHLVFPNGIAVGEFGTLYVSVNSVCGATPGACGPLTGGVVRVTP
jgi:sugar lactone lactonase YvrE